MIKEVYGDASMGRSGVLEWYKLFREGRERVEDDDPFDKQDVSRVKNLLNSDRKMIIRKIADELSIS